MLPQKSYWYSKYYGNNAYLNNLKQFFIKQGKKSTLENLFKEYMINPPIKKINNWNKKTSLKFIKCEQNSTPYVKLAMRKRGKRVKYKITYLEKHRQLKKAILPFAKIVKERKINSFLLSFDKEIENLSSGKSNIMVKRDEIHQLGFAKAPYLWKKKRKQVKIKRKSKMLLRSTIRNVSDSSYDNNTSSLNKYFNLYDKI
jgi:ribosomal protein S7